MLASEVGRVGDVDDWLPLRYGVSNTAKPGQTRNLAMHSALDAFERRMTRRLYAVGVGIVVAVALLRHFWT